MIVQYLKESFKLTNKNIILATPLILYSLISSLYLLFSMNGNMLSLICSMTLLILMFIAFLSGWANMLKNTVENSSNGKEAVVFFKDFTAGVGEYFLSYLGFALIFMIISSIVITITYFIGMKFIGHTGIPTNNFDNILTSTIALKDFIDSLSPDQLSKLQSWNLLFSAIFAIKFFLLMFFIPAITFKSKNPFKALIYNFKDIFSRKFLNNVKLYIALSISYFILSIINTFIGLNPMMHIFTIVNFYYLVLISVFVYYYYYENYIKIGSNIDKTV